MPELSAPPAFVVLPHTSWRSTNWYIDWEDLPDDWAILAMPMLRFYFPGHRTESWTPQEEVVMPEDTSVERRIDFEYTEKKNGGISCFSSMAAARSYILRQRKKQCSKV